MKNYTEFLTESSTQIEEKVKALVLKATSGALFKDKEGGDDTFGYEKGRKYFKVYTLTGGNGRSVWAFIDQEGNMFKPAGWKAPAKGVRGHIDKVLSDGLPHDARFGFGSLR